MAELETYLTLQEATDKYKISAEVLTQLASSGKIRAVRLNGNGGGIAVAEEDVKERASQQRLLETLKRAQEKHAYLDGQPIRLNQAANRYNLHPSSLWRWARAGYIRVYSKEDEWAIELDEKDVAVISELSRAGLITSGRSIKKVLFPEPV
ncbi:MAG: hypothetical protein ABIN58_08315 [candidate division WOR-3 bacterium]